MPSIARRPLNPPARLILASNRLPVTVSSVDGHLQCQPSDGGLIHALLPILSKTGGTWVGWTGAPFDREVANILEKQSSTKSYSLASVSLTAQEAHRFYAGCANQIIWPLFHGVLSRCIFDHESWEGYRLANEKFADTIARLSQPSDFIWAHDYHLMMLADALRARRLLNRLAYFHHIPFPSPDIFDAL